MDTRLLWLALGAFAGSVESTLVVGTLPAIAAETGVSISQAGLLIFGYSVAYGIGTPVLSTLFGRLDRRMVVAGAEATFGLMAVLFGLLPGFLLILMARTLLALGAGLFTSTAQATAVALAPPGQRGRAISTVVMGGSIAVAAGAPLAAWAAELYGWRIAYVGLGLIAIAAAATMALRLPGNLHGDPRTLRERIAVVGVPGVPLTLLTSLLGMLAMFMPLTYLAPIATGSVGLDKSLIPVVLLAYGIGGLCGNPVGGLLADRIGPKPTMLLTIAVLIVLLAFMPLLAGPGEPVRTPAFLVYVALFGLLNWAFFPPQLMRLAVLAPRSITLAASLNLTAMNLGGALAALAGGYVLEHFGLSGMGLGSAAVALLALLTSYAAPDRPRG